MNEEGISHFCPIMNDSLFHTIPGINFPVDYVPDSVMLNWNFDLLLHVRTLSAAIKSAI